MLGRGAMGNRTSSADSADYASRESHLDAYGRRIAGVQFTPDSKSLIFTYQGHNRYNPKYWGSAYGYTINSGRSSTYNALVASNSRGERDR